MKRLVLFTIMAFASVFSVSAGLTVRPAGGRIWQTHLTPSEEILWPWSDGADSARLAITNLRTSAGSRVDFERSDAENYGSYKIVAGDGTAEELYFLALEQYAGEKLLSRFEARVAVIPGVEGGGITVRSKRPSAQRSSTTREVFAYDADWGSTYGATGLSLAWENQNGLSGEFDLEGTSGYDILDLDEGVLTRLTLFIDGVARYSRAVRNGSIGLTILVR